MAQQDIERTNSILLKTVTGMVSAGFTITLIILNNMWSRMDKIESQLTAMTVENALNTQTSKSNSERIAALENNFGKVIDFSKEFAKLYALKPDEIKVRRSQILN